MIDAEDPMDPTKSSFFELADRRLAWIDQRAAVLAQDIANADTPGWHARDIAPFVAALGSAGVSLAATDPRHLGRRDGIGAARVVMVGREVAPDGNDVSIDEQLVKLAQSDTQHALAIDLYKKYLGLFRTALGR